MRAFIIVVLLIVSNIGKANALSCASPILNKEAIESHAVIFEGVLDKSVTLGNIRDTNEKVYVFHVSKYWYGGDGKSTVRILAAPGWAQEEAYLSDRSYMVFGKAHDEEGVYTARPGWCGFDIQPAEVNRKILQEYSEGLL
jgi:hypothetical protein